MTRHSNAQKLLANAGGNERNKWETNCCQPARSYFKGKLMGANAVFHRMSRSQPAYPIEMAITKSTANSSVCYTVCEFAVTITIDCAQERYIFSCQKIVDSNCASWGTADFMVWIIKVGRVAYWRSDLKHEKKVRVIPESRRLEEELRVRSWKTFPKTSTFVSRTGQDSLFKCSSDWVTLNHISHLTCTSHISHLAQHISP